jgi:hypothetical protein
VSDAIAIARQLRFGGPGPIAPPRLRQKIAPSAFLTRVNQQYNRNQPRFFNSYGNPIQPSSVDLVGKIRTPWEPTGCVCTIFGIWLRD